MAHTCPWWLNFTFDNPLRDLVLKPEVVFGPHVRPGMTVLDVGCGTGYNSLGLARMVGENGVVIAVDLQERSLLSLRRRADKAGLGGRLEVRQCSEQSLLLGDVLGVADFAVTFWMVHEVPDQNRLFSELCSALAPGGRLLVAEPRFHVKREDLERSLRLAQGHGLEVVERPRLFGTHSALLEKRPRP